MLYHNWKKCFYKKIKQDICDSPLTLYGEVMKSKECEKYLGDMIYQGGNAESARAPIDDVMM